MTQENEETRRRLEYAHRFAIEHLRDESRAFWAKVAALLTVNSLLIAGFILLYRSDIPNPTLLLTVAGAGIAIQAMWLWFTITSYGNFESLGKLIAEVEDEIEKCDEYKSIEPQVSKVWHYYGQYRKEFYQKLPKPLVRCIPSCLRRILIKNPAAAIAIVLFFVIFLGFWIHATFIVKAVNEDIGLISYLMAILLPGIILITSLGIVLILLFGKTEHDKAVKIIRIYLKKKYQIKMDLNNAVGTIKKIDYSGYDKVKKIWYLCEVITNRSDLVQALTRLKNKRDFLAKKSKEDKVNCFIGVTKNLHRDMQKKDEGKDGSEWEEFRKRMKENDIRALIVGGFGFKICWQVKEA